MLRTSLTALPQIALFYLCPNATGLIIGFAAQGLMLHWFVGKAIGGRRVSIPQMKAVARRYKRQALVDVPNALIFGACDQRHELPAVAALCARRGRPLPLPENGRREKPQRTSHLYARCLEREGTDLINV